MKDFENDNIGKASREDPGITDYGTGAADVLSKIGCLGTGIMILILLVVGMCSSCNSKVVTVREEVPVYLHDTLTNTIFRMDSVLMRDSVYFETFIKGDSVTTTKYIEKWRTKVDVKHDTAVKIVEVPVTYTECTEIKVPASLTKWQKAMMYLGYAFMLSIAVILAHILYTRTRVKK